MSKKTTSQLIKEFTIAKKQVYKKPYKTKINKKIKQIKNQYFTQGNYKIIWEKPKGSVGLCSGPKDRRIWIDPSLDDEELLRVAIDESIHACLWPLDNDYVAEMSDAMSSFLYKIGFKLEKK